MKIGLDILGGDFAPQQTIEGAILALRELKSGDRIVLIGDESIIKRELSLKGASIADFDIVHAPENIQMHENPIKAFETKHESSIVKGFNLLAQSQIDGFASLGNTGAMLVGTMHVIQPIPGVIRPCISSVYPNIQGGYNLLLDVGFNPDSKPEMLLQYGIIGSIFSQKVFGISQPKVGLLNIGAEPGKGNVQAKAAYDLLASCQHIQFVGNIEPNRIYNADAADVIVTNGFVGNIVLKQAEAFYSLLKSRNISDPYFEKYNFELYGGTPVLGINRCVIIGHGSSNSIAVKNMVLQTARITHVNLCEEIIKIMHHGKDQSYN